MGERHIPCHYLKGNKRKMNVKHMVFFDTETYKEPIDINYKGTGETFILKLRLGWVNYIQLDKENNVVKDEWLEFHKIHEFWDYLESFPKTHEPVFVFAHNTDFDCSIVNAIVETAKRGWQGKSPLWSGKVYIWSLKAPNGRDFRFLDSMNFCGGYTSLKSLGKAINLPKLDVDGANIANYSDEEVSVYCHRDTEIVREYMLHWLSFNTKHDTGHFCNTLAAQSLAAFQHKAEFVDSKTEEKRTEILIHGDAELSQFERSVYHGGWVENFFIGKINKKVYKLDVNSFHPSIMKDTPLPYRRYGNKILVEPTEKIMKRIIKDGRPFVIDAEIESPDRLIPIKMDNRGLVFPVGVFRAQFTSIEYKRLLEIGGKVLKVYKIQEYDEKVLFHDYMEEFYQEKERYAREDNKVFKDLAKAFMNSLEGKFAQHNENLEVIGEYPDPDIVKQEWQTDDKGVRFIARIFGGHIYKASKEKIEGFNSFITISCFIRAKTRVLLSEWFQIVKEAGGSVFYTDTDSLFVDEIGYKALEKAGMIDEFRLGALKIEGISDKVEFRNLKDYSFGDDHKTKGKSEKAVECKDGKGWTQTKFLRTKGMIQKGVTGGVIIIEGYKITPRGVYRKGTKTQSGWVQPLELPEYEPQKKLEI